MPRPKKWPQVLKRDRISVNIRRSENKGDEPFTVEFYEDGERHAL